MRHWRSLSRIGSALSVADPGDKLIAVIEGEGEEARVMGIDRLDWKEVATFAGRPAVYRRYPMSDHLLLPHGEDLRRAVLWLSEHHQHDIAAIEEASLRFDLSPLDEEFLIRHWLDSQRQS